MAALSYTPSRSIDVTYYVPNVDPTPPGDVHVIASTREALDQAVADVRLGALERERRRARGRQQRASRRRNR